MQSFIKLIDRIATFLSNIAAVIIFITVAMFITEIIIRTLFKGTIYITNEYSGYFLVSITFFSLAYTLKEKGHIRMTFLHKLIKRVRTRLLLDLYSYVVGFALFCVVTWVTFNVFLKSLLLGAQSITVTATYLAIPQISMVIGTLIITLQFLAEIFRVISEYKKVDPNEYLESPSKSEIDEAEMLGR